MVSSFSYTNPGLTDTGDIIDIDAGLIHDLQDKSDMAAFTQLMNKYKRTVFGFCFRYTGNREDAEDVSQEIFIKVFRNIRSFRGDSKFSTWLYRLTVNTCLNHARWRKYARTRELVIIPADENEEENQAAEVRGHSADPEQALLNKELGMIIRKAVVRLKDKQRSVLILKDFQGRSYEEIAAIMKMNPGTVKSALSRGRLIVAKQIKEYYKP